MSDDRERNEELNVDLAKRETLRRMVKSTAFVMPIVASFSISGLTIDKALAQSESSHLPFFPFRRFS